jgi:hypothetical protein
VQAAPTTKLMLTGVDARKDEESYFQQEMQRDEQHGASSAVHTVTATSAPPAPVGSWAFDHQQKVAQIKAAAAAGQQAKKAAAALHLSLLARQAESRPVEMLGGKAGEAATLQHLAYVSAAMHSETSAYRQSLHGGVLGLKEQQQMVKRMQEEQGGYAGVKVQQHVRPGAWTTDHTRVHAPSVASATSSALAQAEHLNDVRVVQQAVMKHEGIKTVKAETAGSWKMDHGSAARAATQQGAVSPPAPTQAVAANIEHKFGGEVAVAANAVSAGSVGGWVQDHSGRQSLELPAARIGGLERTTTPSTVERAAAMLHQAERAADERSVVLAQNAVQLGTWAEDHGALNARKFTPSKAQVALKNGFSHVADAQAVEAGFAAHGDQAVH